MSVNHTHDLGWMWGNYGSVLGKHWKRSRWIGKKTVMEVWNLEYRSGIRDITEIELEGIFHSKSLPASSLNSEI